MRILLLPTLLTLLVVPARADEWSADGVTATWENDIFGGLDRHYTNGVELSLFGTVPAGSLDFLLGGRGGQWRLTLGQSIYTPEDLEAPALLTNDRPYAGWLRLGASLRRRGVTAPFTDRLGVEVGLLGPASGAAAVHELFHARLTGSSPPRGWRHQLGNEVGVRFTYELAYQLHRAQLSALDYEVEPRIAASLGNVQTFASGGATLRFGRLPDPYGEESPEVQAYISLGADVRFLLHDVFLDGSLLRTGGHRVSTRRVVWDLRAGIVIALPGGLTLSYTHTYRSLEFAGQDGRDHYGSLSVSWTW